jgi:hypothetical protein
VHEPIAQVPAAQLPVAFGGMHGVVHEPHAVGEVSEASHPLLGLPSQSPQPAAQVGRHAPETQAVEPCGLMHATPQPPQFCTVFTAVSQPFAGLPLQFP